AKNQAQQAAIDARAKADAAKHEVDGLTLAYEGHTDDKGRWTPGSVPADYEARVADIKVKELGDRYQTLQTQGAGAKELAKAGQAWDAAIEDQRLAHADLDVANTQIDLADATVERDAAQAPVDTLKPDAKSSTSLFLQTAPIGTTTLQSSSLDGSLLQPPAAKSDKPTLAEMSAAAQAANGRYEDAKTKAQHAIDAQTEAYNDLTSPDENTAAKLDTSKWLGREKDITDTLANAKDDVQKKQDALNQARGTGKSDDVIQQDLVALGKAKQSELTAQADVDTLNKMRELRDLQRRQASGEKIDEQDLCKARQAARDALQHSIEAGPELTPENEAKARDTLKTQTAALKDQDAKVLAAQKAYDYAAGTKDEAARLKDLQDAKTQRGTLDRQVRNLQTTLDKIDADRLALAADADYKQHVFPKTSTAWDTDAASGRADEYTVLPDGYDLTSSILPGDHGKPKADGLPVGLKPDDVEVKKENGKWVAHFKADSEQIGYNEKTGALYVHKGDTLALDPTAAEVWEAHAKRDSASKARDDFLQEMKDIAPTAAQLGPDGQPIAGLGLSEDLGARRAAVQKKISDYTKSARHDPGPEPDDIRIARLELTAIDAAQEWQQTDETRAGQDAAQRAGLDHTFADGKSPKDIADNQRLAAKQARQEWLDAINKSKLDQATAQQKD
ncbi:MAG TPA: hypothetical protein VFG86_26615, partial [Chloroflexota bacterium]|nr:hypothetical protein [Chloroflexota bacterium]